MGSGSDPEPRHRLPYSFTQMPLALHLELWTQGPRRLVRQSRYAALLASMHGFRLYEHRDLDALPRADADSVRSFLAEQRRFQEGLLVSLRSDPALGSLAGAAAVARNSQLLWTWDFLSLAVCLDWAPCSAREVPTAEDPVELQLRPGDRPGCLTVTPWPFAARVVSVRCEGQRLADRFETDDALSDGLAKAPWETVEFELVG